MPVGRPTKLDDLTAKRIVDAVAEGASRSAAAEAARISRQTLMNWLAAGRDGDPAYVDFFDRVKTAEAKAEIEMVNIIRQAATRSWQAAAWWLERCRAETYALKRDVVPSDDGQSSDAAEGSELAVVESVRAALLSRRTGT